MTNFWKGALVGATLGVAAVLLVSALTRGSNVEQELADGLNCPGPDGSTAAIAHHTAGYSLYAADHASSIFGEGCEAGPATTFIRFGGKQYFHRPLASMRGYGAVCLVDNGLFGGRNLNGKKQLEDLCEHVGGSLSVL